MGLILDTSVLIAVERRRGVVSFDAWAGHGKAYLSAITCSELLVGVHRADTAERRLRRSAFVEQVLAGLAVLDFDLEAARMHAQLQAALPRGMVIDAHDMLIGATALAHGMPVLTGNVADFGRIPGLTVLAFE